MQFVSKGRNVALDRIRHMVAAADAISEYVARGRNAFDNDAAIRDAIVYQIIVIGEASKAAVVADETITSAIPHVEWSLWARMRDRVTHKYWATDREIVWSTAVKEVPVLRRTLLDAFARLK